MGWGLGLYDPVKIRVKTPCNGYYLMWYYNGWHYWWFLPGRISLLSEGEEYRRLGTLRLSMSSGQIDRDQAAAIRTILLTKEIYIFTDLWWKSLRIEPGSVVFYDNSIAGAEIDFIGIIGNRLLSITGFSPTNYIIPINPYTGYGMLYNWYAATDVRNIYSAGWHVPTITEIGTLVTFISSQGYKLKEIGTTYWNTPNTSATNELNFNSKGAGIRNSITGNFGEIKVTGWILSSNLNAGRPQGYICRYNSGLIVYAVYSEVTGAFGTSIRLLKDSTTLSPGEEGTYTDPSGNIYRTICIGTQEWVADNIATRHYRNGDLIPEVTDNTAWTALTTGARCWYNNIPK